MKQYLVDVFTTELFHGNPAAVCVMDHWPSDRLMQNIAAENNLSETAFLVRDSKGWRLRWFTPTAEINFCGHATLAAAFVLINIVQPDNKAVTFHTQAGELTVERQKDLFSMGFPVYTLQSAPVTKDMTEALGAKPLEAYLDRDLVLVLESEEVVRTLVPDMERVARLDGLCVAVTTWGKGYDCVSRVFAPKLGVPEDPVTGSTHCMIAPLWAKKLGKDKLRCFQASKRSGELTAEICGSRVRISGNAVLFSVAEICRI